MIVTIDPEFKGLIPPLTDEEFSTLEKSILAEGCRDALVVWNGILVDGHNRFEICRKHGLTYETVSKDFADRDEAMDWMDANQLGRRNLKPDDRALLIGRIYNRSKKKQGTNNQHVQSKSENGQNDRFQTTTSETIAAQYGLKSERTVRRYGELVKKVEEIQQQQPEIEKTEAVKQAKQNIGDWSKYKKQEGDLAGKKTKEVLLEKRDMKAEPYSNAKQFSTIAISQLTRIRKDDPQRVAALLEVRDYINQQLEVKGA